MIFASSIDHVKVKFIALPKIRVAGFGLYCPPRPLWCIPVSYISTKTIPRRLNATPFFILSLGRPLEDEVFGLPGGNYPKERGQHRNLFHYGSGIKHTKRFSSLDKDLSAASASAGSTGVAVPNTNSNTASASPFGSKRPRKYSLGMVSNKMSICNNFWSQTF